MAGKRQRKKSASSRSKKTVVKEEIKEQLSPVDLNKEQLPEITPEIKIESIQEQPTVKIEEAQPSVETVIPESTTEESKDNVEKVTAEEAAVLDSIYEEIHALLEEDNKTKEEVKPEEKIDFVEVKDTAKENEEYKEAVTAFINTIKDKKEPVKEWIRDKTLNFIDSFALEITLMFIILLVILVTSIVGLFNLIH
jgi:hypothetical protein